MTTTITRTLPLKAQLQKLLDKYINHAKLNAQALTVHFRDSSYSAERGGFHPVEIMITADGEVAYITDFSYVGSGAFAELAKELDFDFSLGIFGQFGIDYPLDAGAEIFRLWQRNFLTYHSAGIYEVEVNAA